MNTRRGFVLIMSVVAALFAFVLVESIFATLAMNMLLTDTKTDDIKAYNQAEAGLSLGIVQLRAWGGAVGTPADIPVTPLGTGSYQVNFFANPILAGEMRSFVITSTGREGASARVLRLEVLQMSFAQWVYFSQSEISTMSSDPAGIVWFTGGQIIDGPVHTNGQLNTRDSPEFLGEVSSASPTVNATGTSAPIFTGGLRLGVDAIPVPDANTVLAPILNAASAGGLFFNGDTEIQFDAAGRGAVWVTNRAVRRGVRTRMPMPPNGAIYVSGGDLNISGTVRGKVTVGVGAQGGVGGEITVTDNIRYEGPRDAVTGLPTSPDNMLQLSAARNIFIDNSAPHDLEIDAYIVALNDSFAFPGHDTIDKGTLTIYGGIMQKNRGPVGSFERGTGVRMGGYEKNYHYDSRMERESPLYSFPLREADGRILYSKRSWRGR